MLYQIGVVTFDLKFNLDGVSRETTADFVDKPVIGERPPLEAMGEGPEQMTLAGRLFPDKLGGLSNLKALQTLLKNQVPQLVVRGDGEVMGWFVITRITEGHTYLNTKGVGQVIDMQIELKKSDAPDGESYFSTLWELVS
ncbi:phage tail protein [Agrobacterium vitis]